MWSEVGAGQGEAGNQHASCSVVRLGGRTDSEEKINLGLQHISVFPIATVEPIGGAIDLALMSTCFTLFVYCI